MQAAANLDLSKIYSSPVFRSRSSVDSHRELCAALTDHRLHWGRGEVATTLYRRELTHISLHILAYGAEVEVTPDP
ncbi:MAG: AraC family transcriptional regulator, partial [Proteobacteria bacterium]|nr:AraC family transcriptional regulator [Pseudomonadota bacterium]